MAASNPVLITVAGASGNLAQRIITRLLQSPNVTVRGFTRTPEKVADAIRRHERFSIIQGQIDDMEKIRDAVRGASVVICAYQGYNDVMYVGQRYLIDACEELGVDRYIASDFSLDYNKLQLGQHEGKDCMIKIKSYLQGKRVRGVFIMVGCFIETWLGYMNVWDPSTTTYSYWGSGDEPWDVTTFDDAASYAAKIALDPSAAGTFRFRGDKKSTRDVAQIYEKVYGTKANLKCSGSLQQLYDFMHAEKKKYVSQNKWLYMTWFYQYYILNGQTLLDEPLDNDRYPDVKPHDFESFFKAHNIADPKHRIKPL